MKTKELLNLFLKKLQQTQKLRNCRQYGREVGEKEKQDDIAKNVKQEEEEEEEIDTQEDININETAIIYK